MSHAWLFFILFFFQRYFRNWNFIRHYGWNIFDIFLFIKWKVFWDVSYTSEKEDIYICKEYFQIFIIYSTPYRSQYTIYLLFTQNTNSRSREITNRLTIKYSKSSFQFRNNTFPIKLSTNSIRIYIYIHPTSIYHSVYKPRPR